MRWWLMLAMACYSPAQLTASGDDASNVPPDVPAVVPDAPAGKTCAQLFGLVDACVDDVAAQPQPISLGFSTNTSPLCDPFTMDICLVTGSTVEFTDSMKIGGGRALVVVASDTITIDTNMTIDAGRVGPAAADGTTCTGGPPTMFAGAAGGSFQTAGGSGGRAGGSTGMPANPLSRPTVLESGCDGQSTPGANGGHGGGAVYLHAKNAILINGTLVVGGLGGDAAATATAGAAGGGAGGMIALEAPAITIATVHATGGGGGGGGAVSGQVPGSGADAADGGLGGSGAGSANEGGAGGGDTDPGSGGDAGTGETAGGGGGGLGWVLCSSNPSGQSVPPCTTL